MFAFRNLKPYGVISSWKYYRKVVFLWVIMVYFRRIADLRIDHDKTHIADLLHMNLQVYRRYEKGIREIPAWALMRLADYYGTSTDYLLGRTDNPSKPRA